MKTDSLKPNYSPEELELRREWISKMVAGVFSRRGFDLSPEKLAYHAELWEPAFWRVATEQLESVYEAGSAKLATDAPQFVALWNARVMAEHSERMTRETLREQERHSAQAATGSSTTRAAIFEKWKKQGAGTLPVVAH